MKILRFFFFSFVVLFLAINVNAQKIKVKKGQVLSDKVPVASLIKEGVIYSFSNLENNSKDTQFTAEFNFLKITETSKKSWLTVYNHDKSLSTEVPMEYLSATLSTTKGVAELFYKKYNLITKSGIDKVELVKFLKTDRPSLTEEYKNLRSDELAVQKELYDLKIDVDYNSYKIYKGSKLSDDSTLLGTYIVSKNTNSINSNKYDIYDLDNNHIAIITGGSIKKIDVLLNNSKEAFTYTSSKSYSDKNSDYHNGEFIKEAVQQLYLKDVLLGHQLNDSRNAIYEQKLIDKNIALQEAKDNSINIYNQSGYAINEKGERFEGEITSLFEELNKGNISNIGDGGIGSSVKISYKNEKGKTKYKSITAKKLARFCITNQDGSETCYKAMKVLGGPIINDSSDGALALTSSKGKFLKEVYKEGDFIIYQYPGNKKYYLKISDKEKAFNFSISLFGNKEKKASKLKEYLGGCDYTDKNDYVEAAFKEVDTLKKLINYYNTSCK